MAMKPGEIIQAIEMIAPQYLQESWDNSGIQIAVDDREINCILTALEITDEIIQEAIDENADMIVTHHPLIFGGINSVDFRNTIGSYIVKLMNGGISVYSTHTPFDKTEGGNNDYLAELIGLRDISGFTDGDKVDMIGRVGMLPHPVPLASMVDIVAEKLELEPEQMRCVGYPEQMISTVGLCTGAGADLMDLAFDNGCQLFITGDLKYHDAQKAKAMGLAVIDAGHYGTERTFVDNFSERLRNITADRVKIVESKVDIDPFVVI